MARAELILEGDLPQGKMLVVCKDKQEVCFEDKPTTVVSMLPALPKLKVGERAILVAESGKGLDWRIRQPGGVSRGESAGVSLIMILAVVIAYDKWKSRE